MKLTSLLTGQYEVDAADEAEQASAAKTVADGVADNGCQQDGGAGEQERSCGDHGIWRQGVQRAVSGCSRDSLC